MERGVTVQAFPFLCSKIRDNKLAYQKHHVKMQVDNSFCRSTSVESFVPQRISLGGSVYQGVLDKFVKKK